MTTLQRARIGEAELAYRLDGPAAAPVLVLVNSLGTTHAMWDPQVAGFAGRCRLLRYDQRGHGESSTPDGPYSIADLGGDLVRLLDALEIERASICGLSLGAMVAMWVASHLPERVDRLVLACAAAQLGPPEPWHERAAVVRAGGTRVVVEASLARWFTERFRETRGDVLESVATMLLSSSDEGYALCCEAIASMDQRDALAAITAPTLVLAGALDPVTTPATGLALAGAIVDASFTVLSGASHLANLEQPARFTTAVVDHLAGPLWERGMTARSQVLGAGHVARSLSGATDFTQPFQDLITRYAWGDIWTRAGLDRRSRSAITIAMLVALGRFDELNLHIPAGLRNGLAKEEICEILLQSAIYCGVPTANSAFTVAAAALERLDGESVEGGEGVPSSAFEGASNEEASE